MATLKQSGKEYMLMLSSDVVELEGWKNGQEIKLKRVKSNEGEVIALIPDKRY
jgi:hypothetical protein